MQGHDHIYSRTHTLGVDENGAPVLADTGVVYMTALPAGNQDTTYIFNRENDDYTLNAEKYAVTNSGYDNGWTEITVNGSHITVSTYSTKTNDGSNKVLVDSFTIS